MDELAGGAQRALAVAVGALLILVAVAALGAASAAAGVRVKQLSAREAGAYWTPARMRAAKPLEVKRGEPGAAGDLVGGDRGAPHRVPARLARESSLGSDFEAVAEPAAPEFRIHGAVFVSFGLFGFGRCSGTAVHSRNKSVVFTAAHCINSGGGRGRWFRGSWIFVPAYRYGQRPFGVFPANWIDTTRQWRVSGSENYDVGAAVVGRNERGELLEQAVGGAGIAWNLKANQVFDVHGYPAAPPFDGETQRICRGTRFLGHDPASFAEPGPLNLAVACGVSGGASGGGWTIRGDTLNSVTDYGYSDETSPDYGAYFGKEVARLYGRAAKVR
ncbi:MAG TPA: hypothetical protein VK480_00235 [Solirubrobacterales bacterium]|nr:hypothetical protein [Solirubrobacterales bacterium]